MGINNKEMNKLKEEFFQSANKYGDALEQGNHKVANRHHKELMNLYKKIKQNNYWDLIENNLNESSDYVKLWAATFLLKTNETVALNTLKELSKSDKIIGLTAETTINMWNQGMIDI